MATNKLRKLPLQLCWLPEKSVFAASSRSKFLITPYCGRKHPFSVPTYSVFHRGELLHRSIPERWFAEEICVKWGFCQPEAAEIRRQIELHGRATITLSTSQLDQYRLMPESRIIGNFTAFATALAAI
jgi:hypothetical protein